MSLISLDEPPSQPKRRHRHGRRRWIASGVVIVIAVAIAVPLLRSAGAFGSRLRAAQDGWKGTFVGSGVNPAMTGDPVSTTVSGTVAVRNSGSVAVQIVGATMSGTGFRLDYVRSSDTAGRAVSATTPVPLAAHSTITLTLVLQIIDCHAVAATGQRVRLKTDSWRGTTTVSIPVPTVRHDNGGWAVVPATRPGAISSVRYLADAVCGVTMHG